MFPNRTKTITETNVRTTHWRVLLLLFNKFIKRAERISEKESETEHDLSAGLFLQCLKPATPSVLPMLVARSQEHETSPTAFPGALSRSCVHSGVSWTEPAVLIWDGNIKAVS